jgi:hypothetical protein
MFCILKIIVKFLNGTHKKFPHLSFSSIVAVMSVLLLVRLLASCSRWRRKKVKCTLVQARRLCIGRTAHKGSRGIALLIHDHCTRRGWGVSVTPRSLVSPGKDPVPIVQKAGWAPEPVWRGAENFAPTGIWRPGRPARNQSLYRLSYRAHRWRRVLKKSG